MIKFIVYITVMMVTAASTEVTSYLFNDKSF